jgi:hypothetical protein
VPYKRTKLEAERMVLAAAREGLDAVVVNPTTPVGEGDRLGGADLELAELFAAVAELAGLARPRLRLPYATARVLGWAGLANRNEIRLARLPMYFS